MYREVSGCNFPLERAVRSLEKEEEGIRLGIYTEKLAQALAVPFWLWALEHVREEPEGNRRSRCRQIPPSAHADEHEMALAVVLLVQLLGRGTED